MSRDSDRRKQPLADVEIGAAARAERLRFNRVPETETSFDPGPDGESDSHTERENLPEHVEPGVTYRDVRVRWRGGARIVVPGDEAKARKPPSRP